MATSSQVMDRPVGAAPIDQVPLTYGLALFPGFQALDAFGPLDALNVLGVMYPTKLHVIADTLDPVSTKSPQNFEFPGSAFAQSIVPTHTFANAPELDVLIVPGGIGCRPPQDIDGVINYIRRVYPSLKFLITVCTGSHIAARAGVLDGKSATTNKAAFKRVSESCPGVKWVGHARWVVDGNIWTASGVSAGMDLAFAFIGKFYGEEVATKIANHLEYERHTDPAWDPFAELYGL